MIRALVIALTLTGMTLCQHRCMTACGKDIVADEPAAVPSCPCCARERQSDREQPQEPCGPGHDGDCQCQGICGGALAGEGFSLDGLLHAWAAQATMVGAPVDEATACLSLQCGRTDDETATACGAVDGRALRILIASLQT